MPDITFGPPRRILHREYCEASDGSSWKRAIGADGTLSEWEPVQTPSTTTDADTSANADNAPPLDQILLVIEPQSEGEPHHWSLWVLNEAEAEAGSGIGSGSGQVGTRIQVTGDATFMTAEFHTELAMPTVARVFVVGRAAAGTGVDLVRQQAAREPPPQAVNRAAVRENCQGWTVGVLQRLVREGLVEVRWIVAVREMMEPV